MDLQAAASVGIDGQQSLVAVAIVDRVQLVEDVFDLALRTEPTAMINRLASLTPPLETLYVSVATGRAYRDSTSATSRSSMAAASISSWEMDTVGHSKTLHT